MFSGVLLFTNMTFSHFCVPSQKNQIDFIDNQSLEGFQLERIDPYYICFFLERKFGSEGASNPAEMDKLINYPSDVNLIE